MTQVPGMPDPTLPSDRFWQEHYGNHEQVWSGRPNAALVEFVTGRPPGRTPDQGAALVDVVTPLAPGRALDLGAGEGGDSVWLASLGWAVTSVDVSEVALARLRARAAAEGVADRVVTECHDLAVSRPQGPFDLVSAQFFQSPVEGFDRDAALRAVAGCVAPGGLLLVVDHGSAPSWAWSHGDEHAHLFATPGELLARLGLDEPQWTVERLASRPREATGPDGQVETITDTVVALRARA